MEICITIDSQKKVSERKPDYEAGCIFENFTPKQGNSLKILAAGTRNHGVSLGPPPPPPRVGRSCKSIDINHELFWWHLHTLHLPVDQRH